MRDPRSLYEMNPDVSVPPGLPLVAGLTGFADAGGAVAQTTEYLRSTLDTTVVATFDVDELLDYRARRPIILFEGDHLTEYTPPRLALDLARDELGQPFLLLTGFEPDFRWEQFTAAVLALVDRVRGLVDDVDQRHSDAGAAHTSDQRDGERQPPGAHRADVGVAAHHPGAVERAASAGVPAA